MTARTLLIFFICFFITACAMQTKPVVSKEKGAEILYILADGTMEFRGRIMNEEDVVIYDDGRGGERAAIKIMMPLRSDAYRDSITVERTEVDVPVVHKD